jgi:hypothetical protein
MREAFRWAMMSVRGARPSKPAHGSGNDEHTVFDPDAPGRAQRLGPQSDDEITARRSIPRSLRPGAETRTESSVPMEETMRLPADGEGPTPAHLDPPTPSEARRVDPEPSGTAPTYQPTVPPPRRERGSRAPFIVAFLAAAIAAFAVYFAVRGRRTRVLTGPPASATVELVATSAPSETAVASGRAPAGVVPLELDDDAATGVTAIATATAITTTTATTAAPLMAVATGTPAATTGDAPRPRPKPPVVRVVEAGADPDSTPVAQTVDAAALPPARFEDDEADAGAGP